MTHLGSFFKKYRYLILLIILPILFNAYLLLYKETKHLEESFKTNNLAITYEFKNHLEYHLTRNIEIANFLTSLEEFKVADHASMQVLLEKSVLSSSMVKGLFAWNLDGYLETHFIHLGLGEDLSIIDDDYLYSINITDRQYFNATISNKTVISDVLISRFTSAPFISISVPWYDLEDRIQGVLMIYLDGNLGAYLFEDNNLITKPYKVIVDGNGLPILHPLRDQLMKNSLTFQPQEHLDLTKSSTITKSIIQHDKSLYTYLPIKETNWYALVVQPYSHIDSILIHNFLTSGLILVLLLVSTYYLLYLYIKENQQKEMLELIKQERLNTLTEIAAGVAHEIRNPLVAIKGFIQLEQMKPNSTLEKYIPIMLNEIKNIETLITEFLTLSKEVLINFNQFSLTEKVKDIFMLMGPQAKMKNISFITDLPESEIIIEGDPKLLQQVIVNLVKNSFEAVNEGGSVNIKASSKEKWAQIIVSDNGPGMPEEAILNLGKPFNSQKESGTGLGLAISEKIIHMHHGNWEVKTGKNLGTTIIVSLPLYQDTGVTKEI